MIDHFDLIYISQHARKSLSFVKVINRQFVTLHRYDLCVTKERNNRCENQYSAVHKRLGKGRYDLGATVNHSLKTY